MPRPVRPKRSLSLRLKIAAISLLSFLVTTACSLLRLRSTPEPVMLCYEVINPTDTPKPIVTCYTALPPTDTPPPTTFTSPISPLPTPTTTSTPEARHLLLEELLATGRFPTDVAHELES